MNQEIVLALGVGMFTVVVISLVAVILFARARMVSSGNVVIDINGKKSISVPAGDKLLQTLASNDIFLASACGGGGSCAQCKCIVNDGGGLTGQLGQQSLVGLREGVELVGVHIDHAANGAVDL